MARLHQDQHLYLQSGDQTLCQIVIRRRSRPWRPLSPGRCRRRRRRRAPPALAPAQGSATPNPTIKRFACQFSHMRDPLRQIGRQTSRDAGHSFAANIIHDASRKSAQSSSIAVIRRGRRSQQNEFHACHARVLAIVADSSAGKSTINAAETPASATQARELFCSQPKNRIQVGKQNDRDLNSAVSQVFYESRRLCQRHAFGERPLLRPPVSPVHRRPDPKTEPPLPRYPPPPRSRRVAARRLASYEGIARDEERHETRAPGRRVAREAPAPRLTDIKSPGPCRRVRTD